MHHYRSFPRSARTGDLDLHVCCLHEITNIFFAMNHLIYARWLVKYYGSLTKLPETQQLHSDSQNGWFRAKRTRKSSFRTPIDLALDQTIHTDASSYLFGIMSMTNPISARQIWAEFYFFRTTIISSLLDMLDQKKNKDVLQCLRLELINLLCEMVNPFNQNDNERL